MKLFHVVASPYGQLMFTDTSFLWCIVVIKSECKFLYCFFFWMLIVWKENILDNLTLNSNFTYRENIVQRWDHYHGIMMTPQTNIISKYLISKKSQLLKLFERSWKTCLQVTFTWLHLTLSSSPKQKLKKKSIPQPYFELWSQSCKFKDGFSGWNILWNVIISKLQ